MLYIWKTKVCFFFFKTKFVCFS